MEPLVSVLTPCYNGEAYIDQYAKSLLDQTYDNCQIIFMDDGSTDKTKEKIYKYIDEFRKKGFQFEYYYHENCGLGATISEGIQYVKGDYLVWPDVDDIMSPDSIIKKVRFLREHPELGAVRTDNKKVNINDLSVVLEYGAQKYPNRKKEVLFEDYLCGKNMWLQPGCYMIDMKKYAVANPDRYIFPTRTGQDWQILLPILYKYKCGYLDEALYTYIVREGSLSDQSKHTLQERYEKYQRYQEIIIQTIKHMQIETYEHYEKMVYVQYAERSIDMAYNERNKDIAKEAYTMLKRLKSSSFKYKLKVIFAESEFMHKITELKG